VKDTLKAPYAGTKDRVSSGQRQKTITFDDSCPASSSSSPPPPPPNWKSGIPPPSPPFGFQPNPSYFFICASMHPPYLAGRHLRNTAPSHPPSPTLSVPETFARSFVSTQSGTRPKRLSLLERTCLTNGRAQATRSSSACLLSFL